jgi:hypothetical protein
MKLLGIPCLESCGWIVAVLGLDWTSSGFGQNQEQMISGTDPPALRGLDGYSLRNADLPKRIVFKIQLNAGGDPY